MIMALEGFVLGVICLMIVDIKLPHVHVEEADSRRLVRVGALVAIGIFIHYLPEGLAIGSGYMVTAPLGLLLAFAIALHNAPEGFSIAVPLFAGGVSRSKTIFATLVVGLPTALGAFLGGCIGHISPELIAGALGFAGGAMLYITSDELIPEAQRRGHGHAASAGLTLGTVCILVASQLIL
jgi:ZIP family zinc transporter